MRRKCRKTPRSPIPRVARSVCAWRVTWCRICLTSTPGSVRKPGSRGRMPARRSSQGSKRRPRALLSPEQRVHASSSLREISHRIVFRSRKALFDLYVDSKRSVLIAQPDNRDVSVHVVFHLNDLLLCRAHVRNISDREISRNLLLDGHARPCVLLRAS